MSVRREFDQWAERGRDREIAGRHWNTAKHVLARMPIEAGDRVLDLGTGSGYAARTLGSLGADLAVGIDGSPAMARNARSYTDDDRIGFVVGVFDHLPFADDSFDHCFSMEAFYYAGDPHRTLAELRRVLRSGGTFHCAVDYYEENVYAHDWQENIDVEMTLWSAAEYRDAFRDAGFSVATQDNVPDREIEIPPAEEFPIDGYDNREEMIERYRELGTLVTVGVVP